MVFSKIYCIYHWKNYYYDKSLFKHYEVNKKYITNMVSGMKCVLPFSSDLFNKISVTSKKYLSIHNFIYILQIRCEIWQRVSENLSLETILQWDPPYITLAALKTYTAVSYQKRSSIPNMKPLSLVPYTNWGYEIKKK